MLKFRAMQMIAEEHVALKEEEDHTVVAEEADTVAVEIVEEDLAEDTVVVIEVEIVVAKEAEKEAEKEVAHLTVVAREEEVKEAVAEEREEDALTKINLKYNTNADVTVGIFFAKMIPIPSLKECEKSFHTPEKISQQ